jgi:hypothetical protein
MLSHGVLTKFSVTKIIEFALKFSSWQINNIQDKKLKSAKVLFNSHEQNTTNWTNDINIPWLDKPEDFSPNLPIITSLFTNS